MIDFAVYRALVAKIFAGLDVNRAAVHTCGAPAFKRQGVVGRWISGTRFLILLHRIHLAPFSVQSDTGHFFAIKKTAKMAVHF